MTTSSKQTSGRKLGTLMFALILAIIALAILFMSWRTIPPGFVGIKFNKATNKVTTGALEPGWTLVNPLTTSIQEYPVTIQTYVMVQNNAEGGVADDSIKVQSSEAQQLNLDVAVQYRVDKDQAAALYTEWGGQGLKVIEEQVVRQQTRSAVTNIAATYKWEDISGSERVAITEKVKAQLKDAFARRHLILEDFVIREVHLPDNLKVALENKITAQQAAERQRYELEQAQIKAEQNKVEAEGLANAQIAAAKGDAEATKIRADAQAAANKLLAASVNPALIQYQMSLRWDGKLPLFNGGGTTPMINVSDLINQTQPITR